MGEKEINSFLTYLAVNRKVSASTQNQALCAIVFLYKHILKTELSDFSKNLIWAKKSRKIPVVFSRDEVQKNYGTFAWSLSSNGNAAVRIRVKVNRMLTSSN